MGNNSTIILSKNTAKLWVHTQSFRQYIIRSLMGLSKEQQADIFRNEEVLVRLAKGQVD
jgi:hypothetical protein